MVFRLPLTIEVDRAEAEFSASRQIPLKLIYERGCWRAECQDPPVATLLCETLEEALRTAAREISADIARSS